MSTPKRVIGKKLLVASIGVAAISYMAGTAGCSTTNTDSTSDASAGDAKDEFIGSGNLVAPIQDSSIVQDAGSDAPADATDEDVFIGSGNLVPPPDSGAD